jgi:hypothetical protein
LVQAVDHCSHYFGSGCCLLFPLFWIKLLVTVPIILDQAAGYFSIIFIWLLVNVPVIFDQVVCWLWE